MELGLVEACEVLVGNDQQLVVIRVELLRGFLGGKTVEAVFSVLNAIDGLAA
ncbi:hypothetical protein D9M69_580990 [compost metagenome]